MKRQFLTMALAAICALSFVGQSAKADILANGGPIITHPGGMTGAVAGADRSAIGPAGTIFGFGSTGVNRLADDFTLAADSTINSVTFYAYLTGATAPGGTALTFRIWSGGAPNVGTLVFGDTTTNVLTGGASAWAASPSGLGIFRTTGTDTAGNTRRVQQFVASGLNINLNAGTYWFDFNVTGASFTPPVSDPNALVAGNALQSTDGGTVFNPLLDGAVQSAVPFIIEGTSVIPEPGTLSVLALGAVVGMLRRRK